MVCDRPIIRFCIVFASCTMPRHAMAWPARRSTVYPSLCSSGASKQIRDKLLYCEMPKTGSGLLRHMLPTVITACLRPNGNVSDPEIVEKRMPGEKVLPCYAETGPGGHVTSKEKEQYFVIATIREPCDWLVSRWAYKEKGRINFSQYFHGRDGDAAKIFKKRHAQSQVDCWVDVGSFRESLKYCLRCFEDQGGVVNWQAPILDTFLRVNGPDTHEAKRDPIDLNHGNNGGRNGKGRTGGKNSPYNNQLLHHLPCNAYFTPSMAKLVMGGPSRFMYERFKWSGCCSPNHSGPFSFNITSVPYTNDAEADSNHR